MAEKTSEIELRRKARQRKSRKKHLLVGFAVFFIFATAIFICLSITVLFPIKQIYATGSAFYTDEEIIEYSNLSGKNLLRANAEDIAEILRMELPYIDSVEIEKSFPDTIKIKVIDAKEYACYKLKDSYYIVSKRGYVLKKMSKKPQALMELQCNDIKCEVSKQIEFLDENSKKNCMEIIKILEESKIKINSINTVNRYEITAQIENRFEVKFGSGSDLDKKCSHLITMIKDIPNEESGIIDLTGWTQSNRHGVFKKKPQNNL